MSALHLWPNRANSNSMNSQPHSPADAEDLDSTAELPVLDVAALEERVAADQRAAANDRSANTDTWIIPPPVLRVAPAVPDVSPAGDPSRARVPDSHSGLETHLRSLSANLGDVEDRLKRKVAQLAENELALEAARADRAAGEERAQRLERELAEARALEAAAQQTIAELRGSLTERNASADEFRARDAKLTAQAAEHQRVLAAVQLELSDSRANAVSYLETLQTLESRRNVFHNIFAGLQTEIDSGEVQIVRLREEIAVSNARVRDLNQDLDQRVQRILSLEKEVNAFSTSLAQREQQILGAQGQGDELRTRIAELEASVASMAAKRDEQEKAAGEAQRKADEYQAAVAAERKRSEQLTTELTAVRAEMDEWSGTIKGAMTERSEHVAALAAREERIKELEGRVEEQQGAVRALQAESNSNIARAKEIESDLRVAEEAIHRLESDLRNKSARVDELERTNHEWHSVVDEARVALKERDKLINRLEEEAVNSSVLIGQIQQSMQRLDPAQSGTHEAMPEGATRLLIRTDGALEVVHVLGRKTSIGRTPENDLQIDAKFISRHHAVVLAGPARTIIEDLNSTNGVLVNGRRITRQVLQDGDAVVVGRTQFRFVVRSTPNRS